MAGTGPNPGDLRRDPLGGGEREREDGGRNQPQGPLPRGGATTVANHPAPPSCHTGLPRWKPDGWAPLEQPQPGDCQSPPHCTPSQALPTTFSLPSDTFTHPVLMSTCSTPGLLAGTVGLATKGHAPCRPELVGYAHSPSPTCPASPPQSASRARFWETSFLSTPPNPPGWGLYLAPGWAPHSVLCRRGLKTCLWMEGLRY